MATRTFRWGIGAVFALALIAGCGDSKAPSSPTGSSMSSAGGSGGATGSGGDAGAGGTGGTGGEGGAAPLAVAIQFEARVGTEAASCAGTYATLGLEAADVRFADLRFYVHDVRLVRAGSSEEVAVELEQDGVWQHEGVALLDFEDGTNGCVYGNAPTRAVVTGMVPPGEYDGLRFRVGVPFELNHTDVTSAPSPLNLTSLFWDWAFGHIFLAVVTSATPSGGTPNEHFIHLGSTGCMGDPQLGEIVSCQNPNRPELSFDTFDPGRSVVVADVAELVLNSNLVSELGCHSFPGADACIEPFEYLGIDYATGAMTPATQSFFRVE